MAGLEPTDPGGEANGLPRPKSQKAFSAADAPLSGDAPGGNVRLLGRALSLTAFGWLIAAVIFVIDQSQKNWFLYGLGFIEFEEGQGYQITSFFNLIMVWNEGISYGLFAAQSDWQRWLLVAFSLIVTAGLAYWLRSVSTRIAAIGIGLVIGGALGNVVDRVLYGAVADFFHFYATIGGQTYHWYVFNIADAAIVFGVIVLLWEALFMGDKRA